MSALADVVPASVDAAFEELLRALTPLVPDPLAAAVLYGSLAKGKRMTGSSDVNLLLVLSSGKARDLDRLAGPLRAARRAANVAPLVLRASELDAALAAFPVKFRDILRARRVVLGKDPFEGRTVVPEGLKAAARQGLRGLALRLKRLYLERAEHPDLLVAALVDVLPRALVDMEVLLELSGEAPPAHREELAAAAGRRFGFDAGPLTALLAVKKGGEGPGGAACAALFDGLLAAMERAACS